MTSVPEHRKIIHIDMDAFYASVEQMDNPALKGKPLAVGGSKERGVVAAASYEARQYGVHSAMPSSIAARKCPELIFVRPRFERYKELSDRIRKIFLSYTDLVEPLSLDEAYLDVTYNKKGIKSAIKIAMLIRKEIKEQIGLTASAGVSFNKFLAKTASDLDKPDGLSVILPEQAISFIKKLSIEKFHGIGKKTAEKMRKDHIFKGEDLMKYRREELVKKYGKAGRHYYDIVTANDQREVKPDRVRKSIGAERTFEEDITGEEDCLEQLQKILGILIERIKKADKKGKTITLKIKLNDFKIRTRSRTLAEFTNDIELIWETVKELLVSPALPEKGIRLLGITLSQLNEEDPGDKKQLTLDF
jgi:DNA polymerase-4